MQGPAGDLVRELTAKVTENDSIALSIESVIADEEAQISID